MLEEFIPGFSMTGVGAELFGFLELIVYGALIVGGTMYLMFLFQFKHTLQLREVVNGNMFIKNLKAREFKDKEGIRWWQTLKGFRVEKRKIPPSESIVIDGKGRKFAIAHMTQEGGLQYVLDDAKILDLPEYLKNPVVPNDIKKEIDDEKRASMLNEWKDKMAALKEKWIKENKVITSFKPLVTDEKLIMMSEFNKGLDRKKKTLMDVVVPVVAMGSMALVIVVMVVYWQDVGQPLVEMGDRQIAYENIQKEQLQIIKDIKQDVQTIKDSSGSVPTPNQEVPPS